MRENKCDEEEPDTKKGPLDSKIEEMLVNKRFIFLCGAVEDRSAFDIIRKLWYLEANDPGKPILFLIHSPGGSVDSGFAIWDQIKMITSPVYTLVTGLAASMGSILSLCAPKGKRFSCPNARFMIHQPLIGGTIHGPATDLEIQAKEIIKTRDLLVKIYVEKTGKSTHAIEKALDRDTWMNAEEAKEFGLIDGIIHSYKEIGF
jgi:ATP-dependent Clp protease protease subunit